MALNGSGPISLGGSTVGQSINLQIGNTATTQVSFNDTTVRSLSQIPTTNTQQIMPTDFYNKGATVSYVTTASQASSATTTFTFTGISIGTADTNRWVIVAVGYGVAGPASAVSSVTIGGNAATLLVATASSAASQAVGIFGIKLTTGTTTNVVVTFSAALAVGGGVFCSTYRALNLTTLAANASATWISSKSATNLNVTGSAAGFVVGVSGDNDTTGSSWTGLTQNFGANIGSSSWGTSASTNFSVGGAKTISATLTGGTGTVGSFATVYIV
jgi:hypothetical protein